MDSAIDILVFSPHPDDAELGCAGSLILASERGLRVVVSDVSEGERASRGTLAQRKEERLKASEVMGLCDRLSLGLPDTEIGADHLAHRLAIIEFIRKARPRIVLAPFWKDRHPDHAKTGVLVKEAVFYSGVSSVGSEKPHRPERLFFYMIHYPFSPSFVVDISNTWKQKKEAIKAYKSQLEADTKGTDTAISRPEFLRLVEARAIWFGAMVGARYGEPFFSEGPVPYSHLPGADAPGSTWKGIPPFSMF